MTPLDFWEIVNILARLGVALIVVIKLTRFYDHYKRGERLGLGIAGGCALMTIPVIWEGPTSPFAGWAGAMFAVGVLIYFVGRLRRQFVHSQNNLAMVRTAQSHMEGRQ